MPKTNKANISKEQLLADGWTETGDLVFTIEKKVPNRNPLNSSGDTDIKLVVHGLYNCWRFAILLPDGGLLNFVANSMEELKSFEEKIAFYDPAY